MEAELTSIGNRYGLVAIYSFGSRAEEIAGLVRGQSMTSLYPTSDIDIGVQPARGRRLTVQEKVRLAAELEDLFGVNRVDLIVLQEADPFLALDIIRGELIYCLDEDEQAEYELYVMRRAGDLAPYARERWGQILGMEI